MQKELEQISDSIDRIDTMGTDDVYGFTPNGNLGQIAYNLTELVEAIKTLTTVIAKKKS